MSVIFFYCFRVFDTHTVYLCLHSVPTFQTAVEALLGPKTEADLAPPEPKKKVKAEKPPPPPKVRERGMSGVGDRMVHERQSGTTRV